MTRTKPFSVREASVTDAGAIASIYNHYIAQSTASFAEEPLTIAEVADRVREVFAVPLPWLVAEVEDDLVGYAYATPWRVRRGYRFSVEVAVYVGPDWVGRGVGARLYERLLADLRVLGVHTAMAGISLPNEASTALHERFGFAKVAHFEQVGFKFDRWIDVGYWQTML